MFGKNARRLNLCRVIYHKPSPAVIHALGLKGMHMQEFTPGAAVFDVETAVGSTNPHETPSLHTFQASALTVVIDKDGVVHLMEVTHWIKHPGFVPSSIAQQSNHSKCVKFNNLIGWEVEKAVLELVYARS